MQVTVGMMRDLVNGFAPFDTAEDFDNVGLLVGRAQQEVRTALVALDVTPGVIEEAKRQGAQLIVTHHPLLFAPRRDLREEDREGMLLAALIRAELSLIAAHTNFDKAAGGVNDALLAAVGLPDPTLPGPITEGEGGLIRTVDLPEPMALGELARQVEARLGDAVRRFALPGADGPVRRLAVCAGSGGDRWPEALAAGADCFLTGECKLHHAMEAVQQGLRVLEAGHAATEGPGAAALCEALQSAADAVQYPVRIVLSTCAPYA